MASSVSRSNKAREEMPMTSRLSRETGMEPIIRLLTKRAVAEEPAQGHNLSRGKSMKCLYLFGMLFALFSAAASAAGNPSRNAMECVTATRDKGDVIFKNNCNYDFMRRNENPSIMELDFAGNGMTGTQLAQRVGNKTYRAQGMTLTCVN